MPKEKNHLKSRFLKFIDEFNPKDLKNTNTYAITIGWFLTINFFFFSLDQQNQDSWIYLWIILNAYFWKNLNSIILSAIKPLMELLLLLLFVLICFDILLLSFSVGIFENVGIKILHSFTLSFIALITGLVLIINSRKNKFKKPNINNIMRQGVLISYAIIGYLAHTLVFFDHIYYLYLFQVILFIILLKKTGWLESLTKSELFYYFIAFVILFFIIPGDNVFQEILKQSNTQKTLLISIPYYFYLFFKMYVLVLVVKTPIVVIYNHASLSKKLSISGLFQSTIPQLIQFLLLIFVFYFIVSGWQANQLRNTIKNTIENISNEKSEPGLFYSNFTVTNEDSIHSLKGYESIHFKKSNPKTGIIGIKKINNENIDYFLFKNNKDSIRNELSFVRVDSLFIAHLAKQLSVINGSGIMAYPYFLKEWQKIVYNISFWQNNQNIKIFLFGLLSNNQGIPIQTQFEILEKPDTDFVFKGLSSFSGNRKLVTGRLYLPLLNDQNNNSHFAIDIYFDPNISFFNSFVAKIILVFILLFFLFNLFITRRMVKFGSEIRQMIVQKFNQLKNGIREISSGNLDYKVELEGEDEFVEFAERFNQMGNKLKETIAGLREKDRLDHELQIARNVQLSLLPAKIPVVPGFDVAAIMETATEVGGDFYDIFAINENKYLFTIGDVSGKGSSAAFYMAQFISLLRYSVQFTDNPEEVAFRLNNYFTSHVNDKQIFVTAIIGILDLETNEISMVRAGHNLPMLIPGNKEKEIKELHSSGLGFGLTKDKFQKSLKVKKFIIAKGDMLLLYTDGVIEAAHPNVQGNIQILGEEKLPKIVSDYREVSASVLVKKIDNELKSFYGKNPIVDDYTLLVLQRTK